MDTRNFVRRHHYHLQIVLVISAIFGAYALKLTTTWPAWIYPLLATVVVFYAGFREIVAALEEAEQHASTRESGE